MDCNNCNPLVDGWCKYVEETKGLMLDEKCPRVKAFVASVLNQSKEAYYVANSQVYS